MPVVALAKTGEESHMRRLWEDGATYMQTLRYFRDLEDGFARGDPREGIAHQTLPGGKALIQVGPVQIRDFVSVQVWDPARDLLNLFCLHGLNRKRPDSLRGKSLGPCAVVIHDPDAWQRRAFKAAQIFSQRARLRRCRYYDPAKLNGSVGIFDKDQAYRGQNEFRLVLSPGFGMPILLPLGTLRDIASFHWL